MRILIVGRSRSGTTILRDVISHPKNSHIVNEMRIYNQLAVETDNKNYFRFLSGKLVPRSKLPYNISPKQFVVECNKNLKDKSVTSGLKAVEKTIFKDRYKFFGDKSGIGYYILDVVGVLKDDIKIIHIYRDGRDSAASGIKLSEGGKNHRLWATTSAYKNSSHWAEKLNIWFEIKNKLNNDQYLEIKFEDFILNPYLNAQKLSGFTGMSLEELKEAEGALIRRDAANIGYYKDWISDWKKELAPEAIDVLGKLDYI